MEVPAPARTLRLIVRCGPLRRTLGLTVTVAFSVAALKIAAGSAGTAAAGATITHAAWAPLILVSALTVVAATASVVDRSCPR